MKIESRKLIGYLMKISDLHDQLEETERKLEESKKDAMNWFHRWKELSDKYEKEEKND